MNLARRHVHRYIGAMPAITKILARSQSFCERFGLRLPILLAPMAGVSPPALSIAVANAGGLGACGALLMQPPAILKWASDVRAGTTGPFQINLWIPDPPPRRDAAHEARVREFLAGWGPAVPAEAGASTLPDFAAQCDALVAAAPQAVSSVMGLYPAPFVAQLKRRGIAWIANLSTVAEARAAEEAGADVIAVQGMEGGAGIAAASMPAALNEHWWGCSHCCRRWWTRCACRSLRPAALRTRGAWPRRSCWGRRPRKSAPGFCVVPKRASIRPGPRRLAARRPRGRC